MTQTPKFPPQECRQFANSPASTANSYSQTKQLLAKFQALKAGCGLGLFTEFVTTTIGLVYFGFNLALFLTADCYVGFNQRSTVFTVGLGSEGVMFVLKLVYLVLTADDCFTEFKSISVHLRY